jgi:hypothetical protein
LQLLCQRLTDLCDSTIKLAVTSVLPSAAHSDDVGLHDRMVSCLSDIITQAGLPGNLDTCGERMQHVLSQCQHLLESMATFGIQSCALPLEALSSVQALQAQSSQLQADLGQVRHAHEQGRGAAAFAWVPSVLVEAIKAGDWVSEGDAGGGAGGQ